MSIHNLLLKESCQIAFGPRQSELGSYPNWLSDECATRTILLGSFPVALAAMGARPKASTELRRLV